MQAGNDRAARLAERLGFDLPAATGDGAARLAALAEPALSIHTPTDLVGFESRGRLLVIGQPANAMPIAERLADRLSCTVLTPTGTDDAEAPDPSAGAAPAAAGREVRSVRADLVAVSGHLGAFEVRIRVKGEEVMFAPSVLTAHQPFDLVLDLARTPWIRSEVPPPGYFAPGADAEAVERAVAGLPDLVGEFEKPRYFRYDPDICAHGASGLSGCTRCLDVCPTDAIRSARDLIEVDPHLCQGAGACATACPSGAIGYAYPALGDLLDGVRGLLRRYREASGESPVLAFHDGEAGREWLAANAQALPERVLPLEVEEAGSVGLDTWLAALAFGARRVVVVVTASTPASVRRELERQTGFAAALLAGMGYPAEAVVVAGSGDAGTGRDPVEALASGPEMPALPPATFAGVDEKRTVLRLAIEHLRAHAGVPADGVIDLPAGAPFGEIRVDRDACTLCMACAGVCPGAALIAGGEVPRLDFIEWNCVQCGLCEAACPEDAVALGPRFDLDRERREARRTLNEEAPFLCVSCGKPFATAKVIERMREKLAGHPMFQKPGAMRRLEMCEDCRVRDVFKDGDGTLDI